MSQPDTTMLNVLLTPELLVAVANQARDKFEWLDSYPHQPGDEFDNTAEQTAELLEELVRVCAPAHVTQLASYVEGDTTEPSVFTRTYPGEPTAHEYDADEPVAHIVQAIDQIAEVPGTPVINNMMMVAEAALVRARDWAKTSHDSELSLRIGHIEDLVNRYLD